jgi:hypothetical protein
MCSCGCSSTYKEESFKDSNGTKSIYRIKIRCSKCHKILNEYYENR